MKCLNPDCGHGRDAHPPWAMGGCVVPGCRCLLFREGGSAYGIFQQAPLGEPPASVPMTNEGSPGGTGGSPSGALTLETFQQAWKLMEERDRVYRPAYETEPHHPKCAAVRTNNWRDCTCSTGTWLFERYGHVTNRVGEAIRRTFEALDRSRDALLTHFALVGGDD